MAASSERRKSPCIGNAMSRPIGIAAVVLIFAANLFGAGAEACGPGADQAERTLRRGGDTADRIADVGRNLTAALDDRGVPHERRMDAGEILGALRVATAIPPLVQHQSLTREWGPDSDTRIHPC